MEKYPILTDEPGNASGMNSSSVKFEIHIHVVPSPIVYNRKRCFLSPEPPVFDPMHPTYPSFNKKISLFQTQMEVFFMRLRHYSALAVLFVSALIVLAGCGNNQPTAESRFQSYVKAWQNRNFTAMYGFLSESSRKSISKPAFVARYQRIYDGITAGKMTASVKKADQNKKNSVPFKVTLATVAGPVSFSQSVQMTQEKRNNQQNWYVNWQPSLILPGMKTGDKVRVDTAPSKRGEILDRNGKPLAMDGTAASIGVVPGQLGTGSGRSQTISRLSQVLGVTNQQISDALAASWVKVDSFVPIRTVDATNLSLIRQATTLPGVVKTNVGSRVYPDGQASGHLTGYVGPITADLLKKYPNAGYSDTSVIGRAGLEQLFENQLRQHDGATIVLLNSSGAQKGIIARTAPKNGQNVQLTIDQTVQDALFQEMKSNSGTAAAINPKTGDILGLVSAPSYDPNSFALGISSSAYTKLNNDPMKPLQNRFTAASAPGSVFKPVTAAIALDHQAINPAQSVAINGLKWQNDKSWGNFYVTRLDSAPSVNLEQALYLSDNIYFAQTALKIGGSTFAADAKKFGFGEPLPIPYPMQPSTISNSGNLNDSLLLANSGYGQGQVSVNPLHLSLVYSAFVNDGSMIKPRLIKTSAPPVIWKKNVMSAATAQLLNKDLIQVVNNPAGTAHDAQINGLSLAGKTGTPEFKMKQGQSGRENGWFVAYNTDNPRLLVTMVVENTQNQGGSHSVTPKVRNVFQKLLKP